MFTSNLIASKITKDLADKLKDYILQGGGVVTSSGSKNIDIYVSANGSDSTGDGTQAKPYKTINYIVMHVLPYIHTDTVIYIHPLTDITEDSFSGFMGKNGVIINQQAQHTITFNRTIGLRNGVYSFFNCVFNKACDLVEKGYGYFNNCTFNPVTNIQSLRCRYQSFASVYTATFIMDNSVSKMAMACYDHSFIHLAGTLTFKGDCTYLMEALAKGSIYIVRKATINTSQATGAKYFIHEHSNLILVKRGDAIFGDNLTAGTVDESSKVY